MANKALEILRKAEHDLDIEIRMWKNQGRPEVATRCKIERAQVKQAIEKLCAGETSDENSGLHKHIVTAMLPFLEEMSKHENEQLGKLLTPYKREKHANNKYCIAIVKELIESRFGN